MTVVFLRERHRQRTAGITQVLPPSDALRLMDMPQRGVGQTLVECIRRDRLEPAHNDPFAAVVVRQFGTGGMQMPHRQQGFTGLAPDIGIVVQLPVHTVYTGDISIVPLFRSRIIPLAEIRDCQAPGLPLPFLII